MKHSTLGLVLVRHVFLRIGLNKIQKINRVVSQTPTEISSQSFEVSQKDAHRVRIIEMSFRDSRVRVSNKGLQYCGLGVGTGQSGGGSLGAGIMLGFGFGKFLI
jgi:hypothetical protein